jgi:hypothetical protein
MFLVILDESFGLYTVNLRELYLHYLQVFCTTPLHNRIQSLMSNNYFPVSLSPTLSVHNNVSRLKISAKFLSHIKNTFKNESEDTNI